MLDWKLRDWLKRKHKERFLKMKGSFRKRKLMPWNRKDSLLKLLKFNKSSL